MSNQRILIYIAGAASSVFDSQVMSLLEELSKREYFDRMYLLLGTSENEPEYKLSATISSNNLKIIYFKQYPNYRIFSCYQKKALSQILDSILVSDTVIHIRGESLAGLIKDIIDKKSLRNVKLLTDIRGVAIDELNLYVKNTYNPIKYRFKITQLRHNLYNACKRSDHISCVSDALKDYLLDKISNINVPISVNHCLAAEDFVFSSEKRILSRTRLGIPEDEILCVFVTGGKGLHQNISNIVNNVADRGYKILNLSKTEIINTNVINRFVPYREVPQYLCAADIGIVWRNSDIVNKVASPVKFSEYVCCGLPVISNNGVDLITKYINETGYGRIISNFSEINPDLLSSLTQLDRKKISDYSRNVFSSRVIVNGYLKSYDNLMESIG